MTTPKPLHLVFDFEHLLKHESELDLHTILILFKQREQEWREAVAWLKREIWSECMKDHNIQLCGCQLCKQRLLIESLIDTAFVGQND